MIIGVQGGHGSMEHTRMRERRVAGLFGRCVQCDGNRSCITGKVERAGDQGGGRRRVKYITPILQSVSSAPRDSNALFTIHQVQL